MAHSQLHGGKPNHTLQGAYKLTLTSYFVVPVFIPISFPFHHVRTIIQVWVFDHPYLGVYFLSIYIRSYAHISTLGHAYFHRQWRNQDGHQPRGGYLLSNHIHCLRFIFPELWPPSQSSLHTRCCHLDHCRSSQVDHGILIQGWLSNAHFHR